MKISLNWLKDYVEINEDLNTLKNKITNSGISVQSLEKICPITNIVVGHVIKRIDHPNSDHLNVCTVDLKDEIVTIVCGASNVKDGIKVIVAKDGAVLPNITIKKTTIRGVESNGMICALNELGLEDYEEYKDGIHILPNEAITGDEPLKYIGYDDVLFDLDLNPNRFDCMSVLGFAYEVGAVLNQKIKEKTFEIKQSEKNTSDYIKITSKTENLRYFSTKVVKNIEVKESPEWIKKRLLAQGIRPINNVVDISNYVMLEYNQPLHFYDLDKVGNELVVRMANKDEKVTTIDSKERILNETDIVIANNTEAIGIAGVMGGKSTEVTKESKNILIEAALFNPYNVRYTSIKQNLRSEASIRLEKELSKENTYKALQYASYLLQEYANGEVLKDEVIYDNFEQNERIISVTLEKINSVLGLSMNIDDVKDILERLMFKYNIENNNITVTVPTRRMDINIKEDIIEELGRLYGFDKIIGKTPKLNIKQGSRSKSGTYIKTIEDTLENLGLYENRTYTLVGEKEKNLYSNKDIIELSLPMSEDKKYLRTEILPSLINEANYNLKRGIKDIKIYETSTIYYKKEDKYVEENHVAALISGKFIQNKWQNKELESDFYLLKGITEELFNYLSLNGRYVFEKNELNNTLFHKNKSAVIKIDNQIVGIIGHINPSISNNDYIMFEYNIEVLKNLKVREIKYKEISKYPSVNLDFAIIVDKNKTAAELIKTIKKSANKTLINVEVFDVYYKLEDNKKSIGFSLTFQDNEKTLEEKEISSMFNEIIEKTTKEHNATLRNK